MSDLLNMNIMVMSQKPKFMEMTNEYEITYENGTAVFRAPIPPSCARPSPSRA